MERKGDYYERVVDFRTETRILGVYHFLPSPMSESIICPNCQTVIDLDEIVSHRFQEKIRLDRERMEREYAERAENLKKELRETAKEWADKKSEERLREHQKESEDMKNRLKEMEAKRTEEIKAELELRRQNRELAERMASTELELARRLDEERKKFEEGYRVEQDRLLEERLRIEHEKYQETILKKDKELDQVKKAAEELRRKAEQGSQQMQGEVRENNLRDMLAARYPEDRIDDVPQGVRGADLIHTVRDARGRDAGIILWESKHTKAFSRDWIKKLRDDRAHTRADACILVTTTMPEDMHHFVLMDDVWVCEYQTFLPLAHAIRIQLLAMAHLRSTTLQQDEKKAILYQYLASNEFRTKIENVIDAFRSMKDDLDREKNSMQRLWKKREQELERVINNTVLFWGDMQGIMGRELPVIEYLELDG